MDNQPPQTASHLESMPHLQHKVCLMWGSPELDVFLSRLVMDSRDGQRQGLPVKVAGELLFLAQTNKLVRAIDLALKLKIPLKEAYQKVDAGDQERLHADALDNPMVSRDTVIQARNDDYRATRDRQRQPIKTEGAFAKLGHLVFRLALSKAALILIAATLAAKLLWPYFSKVAG